MDKDHDDYADPQKVHAIKSSEQTASLTPKRKDRGNLVTPGTPVTDTLCLRENEECDKSVEGTAPTSFVKSNGLDTHRHDKKGDCFASADETFSHAEDEDFHNQLEYGDMGMENGDRSAASAGPFVLLGKRSSSFRRVSHRLSKELVRRRSSLVESLPETPEGWAVLVSFLSSAILGYELHLQNRLTCPPLVYGQCGPCESSPLLPILQYLTRTPDAILTRDIQPSMFVGTRGSLASTASFLLGGPPSTEDHVSFREILTMGADGARIALDWELPPGAKASSQGTSAAERQQQILMGPIQDTVVLILHGMNNDSSFGYVRSLMRSCTDRGWAAVGMNFRGCGGIKLATPRFYSGGYTGDIRGVVQSISARLADKNVPMFLVGNSLGANLVTKYLAEEGLSGTLPSCVAGGVSLGNPLLMHVSNLHSPFQELLALGIKKDVILNWGSFRNMTSPDFHKAIHGVLIARTIGDVDEALAPIMVRNEPIFPFAVRVGYKDAEAYWADASSFKQIQHVSVPLLQIIAGDDMIVYKSFRKKLTHCIRNPNVMCVETRCGGHLGWQESPPESNAFGFGTSWANRATTDFFDAILKTGAFQNRIRSDAKESKTGVAVMDGDLARAQTSTSHRPNHSPVEDAPILRSKL